MPKEGHKTLERLTETIETTEHNQRRVLEYLRGAPWSLLGVCDVGRESIFLNLTGVGWALWRLCEAQVRQTLWVGEDQEMRDTQWAGNVYEILEVVPLLLLELEGGVGEHELAEVLLEVAERGGELAAGEDEALGDPLAGDLVHVGQGRLLLPRHRRRHLPFARAPALAAASAAAATTTPAAATPPTADSRHGLVLGSRQVA